MSLLSLGVLSGVLVGLVLGVIGSGGSILAVPLLLYVVGVRSPHVAIGTSAVAVALSAALNLLLHAQAGTVKWSCAALFALAGVAGAWIGSSLGKAMEGQLLLVLFGLIMLVIGIVTLRRRARVGRPDVQLNRESFGHLGPRLLASGFLVGGVSGFFGIGGGFLTVPSLLFATDMPIGNAIGSSLLAVCAFGVTTALNYARSGLVDWPLAAAFVAGGLAGGVAGTRLAVSWSRRRGVLSTVFAGVVIAVGLYVISRGAMALLGSPSLAEQPAVHEPTVHRER
ncbi:MAG TPA: sulfite exporter TauE/SafE family protein [Steroidobacteraceae bacterium]|nr:sulfite exporter TauE/SafE family protein [Steroidobacteraceae bacterium]